MAVGYVPEAFVNYLALLGWSPGGNREMVPPDEIAALFDITRVRKAAAFFDLRKLDWLNGQYVKQLPVTRLGELIAQRLVAKGWLPAEYDRAWMGRVAAVIRDRIKVLEDVEEQHAFLFHEPPEYQPEAVSQHLRQDGIARRLETVRERLQVLPGFDAPSIEAAVRGYAAEQQMESKALIHPLRVAVTGRSVSPPLFDIMSVIGKEKVLARLEHAAGLAKAA
jgi:glutamyl-tRNA synthetase